MSCVLMKDQLLQPNSPNAKQNCYISSASVQHNPTQYYYILSYSWFYFYLMVLNVCGLLAFMTKVPASKSLFTLRRTMAYVLMQKIPIWHSIALPSLESSIHSCKSLYPTVGRPNVSPYLSKNEQITAKFGLDKQTLSSSAAILYTNYRVHCSAQ